MVQFAPDARLVGQLFAKTNEDALVPVKAMPPMLRDPPPVLVRVTLCEAVDAPTASSPYDRLLAESDTAGGRTPVPVRLMLCGEPVALSVMVTAAVCAPVAVGAKCPWMLQLAPTARLEPQLFANTNEDAFAPVTRMLVIDSFAWPVLVMDTLCEALTVPTCWLP